jgi:hypothetical protein
MATHTVNINMQVNDSALQLTLSPFKRGVAKGDAQTVVWRCGHGVQFPATNYFAWKPSAIGTPGLPTRSTDGKTLSITYDNTPSTPNWAYTVAVQDTARTELIVTIDPDIDNDPPGEPPDED